MELVSSTLKAIIGGLSSVTAFVVLCVHDDCVGCFHRVAPTSPTVAKTTDPDSGPGSIESCLLDARTPGFL